MKRLSKILTILFVGMAFFPMAVGCTRTIYKPVVAESVSRDSVRESASITEEHFRQLVEQLSSLVNKRDSVIIRDSIVTVINSEGEVVGKEVFHHRDRNSISSEQIEKIKATYDSLAEAKVEKFTAIIEELQKTPVLVERELTSWEKFRMQLGTISLGVVAALLLIAIGWSCTKLKKK